MTKNTALSEFVSDTLTQIVKGIREAQSHEDGDYISPRGIRLSADHAPKKYLDTQTNNMVQMIDFDVAITSSDSSSIEAGAKVSVIPFKIGASTDLDSENSSVSRIRFSVPLAMPEAEYDIGFRADLDDIA